MNNIVDLGTGRSRPRRFVEVAQDSAQILFFTGVRYVRAHDDAPLSMVTPELCHGTPLRGDADRSGIALELAAH